MTQYLTKAQGMPKPIEQKLEQKIKAFIWDGEGKPPISIETMYAPIDKGGKQVLNLAQCNDAIELTWLCNFLTPTAKRPTWTFFAHALFNHFAQKSPIVHEEARVNVFAQTWTPRVCSLPQSLQRIIKAARKYNLNLEALFYAEDTLDSFPVWFHIGADEIISKQNNTQVANCLCTCHKVTTVGQL